MIHNLEVTGDGTTKTISALAVSSAITALAGAASMRPAWVQFIAATANGSTPVRVGDVRTDSTHGLPMVAGSGLNFPPVTQFDHTYSLTAIYLFVNTGDKLSVAWEA